VPAAIGASQLMLGQVAEANQSFADEHNSLFGLPGIAIVARKQGRNAEAEAALARLVAEHGDNGLYQQAHLGGDQRELLHRDTLGQVPRLIDVGPLQDRAVIRQQL
jgi:hypothetical protein